MEAVNEHGGGPSSQRVVFRTASMEEVSAELEAEEREAYNETACCVKVKPDPTPPLTFCSSDFLPDAR